MKVASSLLTLLILVLSLVCQAQNSSNQIKGISLLNCNSKAKCIKLQTSVARSGNTTQLMTFSNFEIEMSHRSKKFYLTGNFGYLDMQENKIVLTLDDGRELELNLKDLSERYY